MKSRIPPKLLKKVLKNRKSSSKKSPKLPAKKELRVVAADNLNWKPVEIPDTLDDFGGFYGLEEIDGVDVKVVNGQVTFVTKENKNIKEEEKKEAPSESQDQEQDEQDLNEEDQMDVDEVEPETPKLTKQDKKAQKLKSKQEKKAVLKVEREKELNHSGFQSLVDLPDEVDLPDWSVEKMSLSSYTLQGLSKLGFNKPTPIQKGTIPIAVSGKDVVGKAMTGSGKTFAYGIPILEKYLESHENTQKDAPKQVSHPSGIVFAPTRELAHQVVKHLENLAQYSPLTSHGIVSITGGLSIQKQERLLSHGPGIIVATPGRLLELMEKDSKLTARLASTDMVVFDEADRLLQDGHFEELEKIIELMTRSRPKTLKDYRWQTLVFSATFSTDLFGKLTSTYKKQKKQAKSEEEEVTKLLTSKLKFKDPNPAFVDANPKETVAGKITEALIECGAVERDLYLYYFLLMYPGTTLVFANSIDSVRRLPQFLNNLNIPTFAIHSQMVQKQRLRSLERFTKASEDSNTTAVLVASDVAARGLDIPNITHVVHYHLPRSADVYVHRSGRTGRAGKEGVSMMICSPQEVSGPLPKLRKLVDRNSRFKSNGNVKSLPIEGDIVAQLIPRVKLLQELGDAIVTQKEDSSASTEPSWVLKAAEDLGIDDLSDMEEDDYLKRTRKRKEKKLMGKAEMQAKRRELKELLEMNIRKDRRRSYLTGGLQNLADFMLKGESHGSIIGHSKVNALDDLKGKKKKSK